MFNLFTVQCFYIRILAHVRIVSAVTHTCVLATILGLSHFIKINVSI